MSVAAPIATSRKVDPGLGFLLASGEPVVRHAALVDLLDRPHDDAEVSAARAGIDSGRIVAGLLAGQREDGGFGGHPYQKWGGAHWRLVSLMDVGVPPDTPGMREAAATVLRWLAGRHAHNASVIQGRTRKCASQDGNGLAVAVYLSLLDDPRVHQIASSLVRWQWRDGGWNCDRRPAASHSSFNETLPPLLGLGDYAQATHDVPAREAAERAAEFLLRHRLIFSERTGDLAHPAVARLRYPPYWHYDALAALRVIGRLGYLDDPRTNDALDFLESRRRADGTWHPDGAHWRPPGSKGSNVEVVDWGREGPNEPLTLGAMRVLRQAQRWSHPRIEGRARD